MSSGLLSPWWYLTRMTYGICSISSGLHRIQSHPADKTTFDEVTRRLTNPALCLGHGYVIIWYKWYNIITHPCMYMYAHNYDTRMLNKLYLRCPYYFILMILETVPVVETLCNGGQIPTIYLCNTVKLTAFTEIKIIIQCFSQWHYSELTLAPWRLRSPVITMFVQQPSNKVIGPRYWPLV